MEFAKYVENSQCYPLVLEDLTEIRYFAGAGKDLL